MVFTAAYFLSWPCFAFRLCVCVKYNYLKHVQFLALFLMVVEHTHNEVL